MLPGSRVDTHWTEDQRFLDLWLARLAYPQSMNTVTVTALVADDDPLVRRALTVFLQNANIAVVAEASDGAAAVEVARRFRPDVALVDVQMPEVDGVEATKGITLHSSRTKVIAITTFGSLDAIMPMLQAGASGYLLKDTEPEDIVAAVHTVLAGNGVLSPRVTSQLINSVREAGPPVIEPLHSFEALSERETCVVQLLAHGFSNAEIAAEIHVSEGTVKAHFSNIIAKWGVRDRVQVLIRAARAGMVSFDQRAVD